MDDRKSREPAINREAISPYRQGKRTFYDSMVANSPYTVSVEDVKKHAMDIQREIDDLKMQKYTQELQNELMRQMEYELQKALVGEWDEKRQKHHGRVTSKNRRLKKNVEAIRMAQEIIQEDR